MWPLEVDATESRCYLTYEVVLYAERVWVPYFAEQCLFVERPARECTECTRIGSRSACCFSDCVVMRVGGPVSLKFRG
jgi:hypothetical protein